MPYNVIAQMTATGPNGFVVKSEGGTIESFDNDSEKGEVTEAVITYHMLMGHIEKDGRFDPPKEGNDETEEVVKGDGDTPPAPGDTPPASDLNDA